MLTVFLTVLAFIFFGLVLIVISNGLILAVVRLGGGIFLLGMFHYALWGRAFSEATAGEREEEQLRQRAADLEAEAHSQIALGVQTTRVTHLRQRPISHTLPLAQHLSQQRQQLPADHRTGIVAVHHRLKVPTQRLAAQAMPVNNYHSLQQVFAYLRLGLHHPSQKQNAARLHVTN